MLTAAGISKHIGDRHLLRDVSLMVGAGQRLTLAGRNGSGKTTLLRILAGELPPDAGTISLTRGARVLLHDQRPPRDRGLKLGDYVLSGLDWVAELERELERLAERMATDPGGETMTAFADAQARFDHAGGYNWRHGVEPVVRGLGFGDDELERDLATFSGGELTRASLARVLAARPDVLLLDEPTNHLDIESLEWLESHLTEVDAAVVLVAHDRWFLESVGTAVLELGAGRPKFFDGPWHAWRTEKAARELAAGRDVQRREAEIARLRVFVERFRYKATKARQAQAKLKQIDRIESGRAEIDPLDGRAMSFSFAGAERSGKIVLELEHGAIRVGDRVLLDDSEIWLERGEHVCLLGPNGSGKSTLIAALCGLRELDAGRLRIGHNVKLGHLAQHAETGHGEAITVLAHAQRATALSEAKTRALLGGFLFTGDDVDKLVTELSGGEAQRLSLAILVSSGANLLILDEPTNHLDVESREALEEALGRFEGTLLLVSHDRALLEAVGGRTVAIEDERLRQVMGGWTEYREARAAAGRAAAEQRSADLIAARGVAVAKRPLRGAAARKARAEERAAVADSRRLERELERAEADLRALEDELAAPEIWTHPERAEEASRRHAEAKRTVDDLFERWEAASAD